MINIRKFICALMCVALPATTLISCGASYNIKGSSDVSILDGQKLFLKAYTDEDYKNIDSCDVVHGQFKFAGKSDSVRLAFVTDDKSFLPVILEEGEISVTLNLAEQKVCGTALNDKLNGFLKQLNQVEAELSELTHKDSQAIMNGEDIDSVRALLNIEAEELMVKRDTLATRFICNNFDNALAASVFQILTLGQQVPQLSPWVEDILSKANDNFKNDPYVKKYLEDARYVEGVMNGTVELPGQNSPQTPVQIPDNQAVPTPNQLASPSDSISK